jgi:hypothetical protein
MSIGGRRGGHGLAHGQGGLHRTARPVLDAFRSERGHDAAGRDLLDPTASDRHLIHQPLDRGGEPGG